MAIPAAFVRTRWDATTLIRGFVILFATVDLVGALAWPGEAPFRGGTYVALSLVCWAAMVGALFRPIWTVLPIGLLLASSWMVGEMMMWFGPMAVCLVVLATTRSRRLLGLAAGFFILISLPSWAFPERVHVPAMPQISVVAFSALGLLLRAVNERNRTSARRIASMTESIEQVRARERRQLAHELSGLLATWLEEHRRRLRQIADHNSPAEMRQILALVEQDAHEALGRLRTLVTTLRPAPDGTGAVEVLGEEVEESLVAHGLFVQLETGSTGPLDPTRMAELDHVLRLGVGQVIATARPGSGCTLRLSRGEGDVQVSWSWQTRADASPDLAELRGTVQGAGGRVHHTSRQGESTVEVRLPLEPRGRMVALRTWLASRTRIAWSIALVMTAWAGQQALRALASPTPDVAIDHLLWVVCLLGIALVPLATLPAVTLLACVVVLGPLPPWPARVADVGVVAGIFLMMALGYRAPRWVVPVALAMAGYRSLADPLGWEGMAYALTLFLTGGVIGVVTRRLVGTLQRHHETLRRMAEQEERASEEERRALAAELHDVVAHQLSLMALQPPLDDSLTLAELRARAARMERLTDSAQHDLDTLVALMRPEVAGEAGSGWAGTRALTLTLVSRLEQAGFQVTSQLDDDVEDADAAARSTVGRVLREAATNVMRYAPAGASCTLSVRTTPSALLVDVTNDQPSEASRSAAAAAADGTGWGLRGLSERVGLLGGRFSAGPEGDCWRVEARIPRWAYAGLPSSSPD